MRLIIPLPAILLILTLTSCQRIKRKAAAAQQALATKKEAAVDKVIPTFDPYHPDTKFNRKRFEECFGFAPTPDVSGIYCYADQMGIDSRFMFSFKCDTATKSRITRYLNLTLSAQPDNFSRGLWQSFPWWDSATISTLRPYQRKGTHEYYKYLWFDTAAHQLYYIDFDM